MKLGHYGQRIFSVLFFNKDRLRASIRTDLDLLVPIRVSSAYVPRKISATVPLLSLVLPCHLSLARVPPALLPPLLSHYDAGERPDPKEQRPRRGLSTSGPRHGGPSGPWHGVATASMAPVTVDQRGRPDTNGSPTNLAPSPSCAGTASLPRHAAAATGPPPTSAVGPLPTSVVGPLPPVNSTC
jgi:hypothetical protein